MDKPASVVYQKLLPELDAWFPSDSIELRTTFEIRLNRWFQDLFNGFNAVYGQSTRFHDDLLKLVAVLARHTRERSPDLHYLDRQRELQPDWFQHPSMVGYVFYVEQFAGNLSGVHRYIDYLEEIGIRYVHLMKVLSWRDGENDGGYAITDYGRVHPSLGTNQDLQTLCTAFRKRGISVCVDLVLNHCAMEHPWAQAALAGNSRYRDYFYFFDNKQETDVYEATLQKIFPETTAGNFYPLKDPDQFVWSTFNDYQWDLNWSNPAVFIEIVDALLGLSNLGVDVFRLDAVAFMWKEKGTNCQNLPQVFDLLQALRACSKIATPAVIHKAEAIVSPEDLVRYFGEREHFGKVSSMAYHNSLMVQYWSSLASQETTLMRHALTTFPSIPTSVAWGTYIRCHDDIGWAITDEHAAAVGVTGEGHRQFLSDYYLGDFPGSSARGGMFQFNKENGDRRINGTFASLAGLESAMDVNDEKQMELAIARILLGHSLICSFGGIPLIFMGDELGMTNHYQYIESEEHKRDSRWLHRPPMNWSLARERFNQTTVQNTIFSGFQKINAVRAKIPHFSADTPTEILPILHNRLFAFRRAHTLGNMVCVFNFHKDEQRIKTDELGFDSRENLVIDRLTGEAPIIQGAAMTLSGYGHHWLEIS